MDNQNETPPDGGDPPPHEHSPFDRTATGGRDQIRLILRDRHFAWVYWEVTAEGYQRCRRRLGRFTTGSQLVLRVRSGSPEVNRTHKSGAYDIPIEDWVGACCVALGPAEVAHFCSVGLRTVSSEPFFAAIARSNVIVPPMEGPAVEAAAAPTFVTPEEAPERLH